MQRNTVLRFAHLVAVAIVLSACAGLTPSSPSPSPPTTISSRHVADLKLAVADALRLEKIGTVLAVFDIDDTLLTLPQDLGSDVWFEWRSGLIHDGKDAKGRDFNRLLFEQSLVYQASDMKPTQGDAAALLRQLQSAGVEVYALTARSPQIRGLTEAALASVGFNFSLAGECAAPLCTRRGDIRDPEIRRAARKLGVSAPTAEFRQITVSDGLVMTGGQDKGFMLQLLVGSLGKRVTDVVFVDDTVRNIESVRKAATEMNARVHLFQYDGVRANRDAFLSDPGRQERAEHALEDLRMSFCRSVQSVWCEDSADSKDRPQAH